MNDNVLICVSNDIVAEDVVAIVQEAHPSPQIHQVTNIDEVCATLHRHSGWAWAVLEVSSQELARADLREALRLNKALPVVLSPRLDDPEVSSWVFLDPPFNSTMLREALARTCP